MERYGYDRRLSTGIVASVGTLGILLPPSVTLIIYGIITDQSIGRLFLAGIVPGLFIALCFVGVIYGWCKINPKVGPGSEKSTWGERFRSLPDVILVVVVFVLIIGGILAGFFTPTEAGSVGTFLVLLLAFSRRDLNFKGYIKSASESIRTACMVLLLLAGSTVLGHFIAVTKIPMIAADWIVGLDMPSALIVFFISLIYLVGGSFIDDLAFMILATPIFYPAIIKLGYDPLWFGILIAITVMAGVVIPPMAICVFIVSKITKTPLGVIYAGVYPFLISLALGGIFVFMFPGMATWLPNLLMR
jgi:tripartite ATP-independent transporter DctM subunit